MSKFSINYSGLSNQITKKAYRLADVQDQLESVGFDVVRFKDNDKGAELWQIQSTDDGDYIVAVYDESETKKTASAKNPWEVVITKNGSFLQISYKGDPLVRLSHDKLGIPNDELYKVKSYLPEKLVSNKKLVKALLSELGDSARLEVSRRYPELI